MNRHRRRLKELQVIADNMSGHARNRHAAAIYIGNALISVGVNRYKTHPLQAKFGKNSDSIYLHAEIDAIVNALKKVTALDLKKATLYVAGVRRGSPILSKPCAGCQRAIAYYDIQDCRWSDEGDNDE